MSTDALRKSPRKPSRSSRARMSSPPQTSATRLVHATHSVVFGDSPEIPIPASPAARIAAVAESAPTTSSRDDPRRANSRVGKMIVYRPVMTGVWAIEVYPITSGIAIAASVTPAITSADSQPGLYARIHVGRIFEITAITHTALRPGGRRHDPPNASR